MVKNNIYERKIILKKKDKMNCRVVSFAESNGWSIEEMNYNGDTRLSILKDEDGYFYVLNKYTINRNNPMLLGPHNPYTIENIKTWLKLKYGEEFILLSNKYILNEYLIFKCKYNHVFKKKLGNARCGDIVCPICGLSRGEKRIKDTLDKYTITYGMQYLFIDLKNQKGNHLLFDFVVLDDQNNPALLIEYNGEDHYYDVRKNGTHEKIKNSDNLKIEYCNKNNIPILIINYTEFDLIEKILLSHLKKLNFI